MISVSDRNLHGWQLKEVVIEVSSKQFVNAFGSMRLIAARGGLCNQRRSCHECHWHLRRLLWIDWSQDDRPDSWVVLERAIANDFAGLVDVDDIHGLNTGRQVRNG
jgi:hypothetical protein